VVAFLWVGNDVGLDLLNTEAVDEFGEPVELMADFGAVLDWAREAKIVDGDVIEACRRLPRRSQAAALNWVHRLRSSTRALVDPVADASSAAAALEAFRAVLGEVPVRLTFPKSAATAPVSAAGPADRLRLALALTAIETLGLDRVRIRRCEGERCVLLYYDTSRNRSRRWCDMAACGNRAKAAAHYERSRRRQPQQPSHS
jgi:predicted RNA-binding Zn ribbon-like protein